MLCLSSCPKSISLIALQLIIHIGELAPHYSKKHRHAGGQAPKPAPSPTLNISHTGKLSDKVQLFDYENEPLGKFTTEGLSVSNRYRYDIREHLQE